MKLADRKAWIRLGLLVLAVVWGGSLMIRMPGESHRGPLPPLDSDGLKLMDELRRDIGVMGTEIGPRNVFEPDALERAARFITDELTAAGYAVTNQVYDVRGISCENIVAELRGTTRPDEMVIVGAHYDTVPASPGANDNGSGVAALLALARHFADRPCERTIRFVAFVNEEPPFFQTRDMGSLRYAQMIRQRGDRVTAMLSLETMGFFDDRPQSQSYPFPLNFFYPSEGNFIAFVGNVRHRALVREAVRVFRGNEPFPSEGVALPALIPGVSWSDHWSFWKQGYPAIMVTDTAPYRYPHYHLTSDTPDKVDYDRLARVVLGLECVVQSLAGCRQWPL